MAGISSLQLSKELGITQESAWFLLQRIRAACGNQTKKLLSGIIEVDETYLGGLEKNKHWDKKLHAGRGTVGKTPVFGMRDRAGQVVAKVVNATDAQTLQGAITSQVVVGSTVCSDEHAGYNGLNGSYVHKTVRHSAKQWVDGLAHTNSIESVWAVLKRGFYGIFHWFSVKHMQLYVDEFLFRLNEGNCKIDTEDRLSALIRGTKGKRLT
jgi:transposase-like protein